MKLNSLIILPFFFFFQSGNISRPQQSFQTPGLPTECARMTLESFQTSSPPPALIPFFPPTDVAGWCGSPSHTTLTPLMAGLDGDKFFCVPSIIPPSSLRQPFMGFGGWGPSIMQWRTLIASHLSTHPALSCFSPALRPETLIMKVVILEPPF